MKRTPAGRDTVIEIGDDHYVSMTVNHGTGLLGGVEVPAVWIDLGQESITVTPALARELAQALLDHADKAAPFTKGRKQ
jgi:hypothetical protein